MLSMHSDLTHDKCFEPLIYLREEGLNYKSFLGKIGENGIIFGTEWPENIDKGTD